MRRTTLRLLYAIMMLAGGLVAFRAAPDFEGWMFPVLQDIKVVPFDPARPDQIVEHQLDRVCWKYSYTKAREAKTLRRSVTIIAPNGERYFTLPIDGRTGEIFNTRNSRPQGWAGETSYCAILPDGLDVTEGFEIENYGQFELPYHLWIIEQFFPTVTVAPMAEGSK